VSRIKSGERRSGLITKISNIPTVPHFIDLHRTKRFGPNETLQATIRQVAREPLPSALPALSHRRTDFLLGFRNYVPDSPLGSAPRRGYCVDPVIASSAARVSDFSWTEKRASSEDAPT
jgi:hypothetical protein